MVKKNTPVKRKSTSKKSSSKKQVPKKTSSAKRIAKGVGIAALTGGLGYAAYKGVQQYNKKKEETPTPTASVYDNIRSFFGFNKKAETIDMCQNELSKLKEELNNANKNGAGVVDQCKNELNKIKNELQKSKEDLDNYKKSENLVLNNVKNLEIELQNAKQDIERFKKYEIAMEKELTILDNENAKYKICKIDLEICKKYENDIGNYVDKLESDKKELRSQYNNANAERATQNAVIKVLKKQIDDLQQQSALLQKKTFR